MKIEMGKKYKTRSGIEVRIKELVEVCDFKIDDKVMVRENSDTYWCKRYFAGVNEYGKPTSFINGVTSWNNTNTPVAWDECRRPTEEELE